MLPAMRIQKLHEWNVSTAEGRALQEKLVYRIRTRALPAKVRLVAGADMAFSREMDLFFGAVVVLSFPELELVECVSSRVRPTFPYVPGLLSFREGPVLLPAFRKLAHTPDVVIFDGHGLAHPRRLGLASHLGLWLGVPSVGCAKSRLVGEHEEPGIRKGRTTKLWDKGEQVGLVVRTRDRVRPVFVSPGHLADMDSSTRLVLDCCTKYRLPEPTRLADIEVAQSFSRNDRARGWPQGLGPMKRYRMTPWGSTR
jgi:deoxyribonuclease V